jgi:hypothetical protein
MPVLRKAATWNTARKWSVNFCLVNYIAAKFINKNPVIVSVLSTRICPNITSAAFIIPVNTILSQRFCATVSNPLMVHRIASVHNSLACPANFITGQSNPIPISMLFLRPVSVCLFAACVNIIRSRRVCVKVCNPQVVHRISCVHISLACPVNLITNQPDACLIWMLLLSSFSVCLFAVCVKMVLINPTLSFNRYRAGFCYTVYLHANFIYNDP